MRNNTSKHAYLILAHSDPDHLKLLVRSLDDERNDIFIHLDAKTDATRFDKIESKLANLQFTRDRVDVRWGDYSLVKATYALLEYINKRTYTRIHLISGADFPLKSQDYIHNFFEKHQHQEFISFSENRNTKSEIRKKMRLYHLFLPYIRSNNKLIAAVSNLSRRIFLLIQLIIGINRNFSFNNLKKGSNWFSITQTLAQELLAHKSEILKEYKYTHCCDEIFVQTIALSCGFADNISPEGNMRFIDFNNGNGRNPRTMKELDYDRLINSPMLFARKFNSDTSGNLAKKIYEKIYCKS